MTGGQGSWQGRENDDDGGGAGVDSGVPVVVRVYSLREKGYSSTLPLDSRVRGNDGRARVLARTRE